MTTGRALLFTRERPFFDSGDALSVLARQLLRGLARIFSRGLSFFGCPISNNAKIHCLSSGEMISHAGDHSPLIILARLRRTLLRRSKSILVFGDLLTARTGYFAIGGITILDTPPTTEASAAAGTPYTGGSALTGSAFPDLGCSPTIPASGIFFLLSGTQKPSSL